MNFSIRFKILSVIAPLVVGLLCTSGMMLWAQRDALERANALSENHEAVQRLSGLIHEMQKERGKSVLFLNKKIDAAELNAQREAVDKAIESLQDVVGGPDFVLPLVAEKIKHVFADYEGVRIEVSQYKVSAKEALEKFAGFIHTLILQETAVAEGEHLEGIEAFLVSIAIFDGARENMALLRGTASGILAKNEAIGAAELLALQEFKIGYSSNMASPGLVISHSTQEMVDAIPKSESWKLFLSHYEKIFANAEKGDFAVNPAAFSENVTTVIDAINKSMQNEFVETKLKISSAHNEARTDFWLMGLVTLVLIGAVMAYAFFVSEGLVRSLSGVAETIATGSRQLASAAGHISSASEELSAASIEQAASLQETTAALTEVRSMVERSAENSENSIRLVDESNRAAQSGKESIQKVLGAIDAISQSNQHLFSQFRESNLELQNIEKIIAGIAEKTKVINDIVFQTKLLSFNASVEAARAGEDGKGFSVVADEVGKLAQLTGQAAREITSLLDESVNKVNQISRQTSQRADTLLRDGKIKLDSGIAVANECNRALDMITANFRKVAESVNQISSAGREQSQGIAEIDKAMTELDQVTQRNSQAAVQSASAASSLAKQGRDLQNAVESLVAIVRGKKRGDSIQAKRHSATAEEAQEDAAEDIDVRQRRAA